jgi:hypothetical protein
VRSSWTEFCGQCYWHSSSWQLLALPALSFLCENQHRVKLVCSNLVETHEQAEFHRRTQINGPANQLAGFRRLRRVKPIQRTVIAAAAVVRRIWAEPRVAEFLAPECPVNQESQRGTLGPLSGYEFGSPVSWKAASRASIAAFTATA